MILVSWGRGPVSGVFLSKGGSKGPCLDEIPCHKKNLLIFLSFCCNLLYLTRCSFWCLRYHIPVGMPKFDSLHKDPGCKRYLSLGWYTGFALKGGSTGPYLDEITRHKKKIKKLSFCCNLLLLDQMQLSCLYLYQNFLWRMLIYILTTFGLKCFFQLISSVCKSGCFLLSEL